MNIHIARNGQKIGSYDLETLKEMAKSDQVKRTDHAYLAKTQEWKLISEIKELNDAIFPENLESEIPPPPPPSPPTITQDNKTTSGQPNQISEKTSTSKKIIIACSVIAVILFGASFLSSDHEIKSSIASLNQNAEWNQKINGGIENLKIEIDKKEGDVKINFDYDKEKDIVYKNIPRQFLVRLFDKNGKYITHFTTKERFVENENEYPYEVSRIRSSGNHLQYKISTMDAEYIEMAEFGFYTN